MEETTSCKGALTGAEKEKEPPERCAAGESPAPDATETLAEEKARCQPRRGRQGPAAVPTRVPQLSCEELEYDSMYVSPLDSSLRFFFAGLACVFLASLVTRLYKITQPAHVA